MTHSYGSLRPDRTAQANSVMAQFFERGSEPFPTRVQWGPRKRILGTEEPRNGLNFKGAKRYFRPRIFIGGDRCLHRHRLEIEAIVGHGLDFLGSGDVVCLILCCSNRQMKIVFSSLPLTHSIAQGWI